MDKSVDYIMVGQGLAGSLLSYELIKEGKKIQVFNENKQQTSSRVAAGLYNPITGRKMVKTWNADNLFPLIEPFYRELEEWVGSKFLHPIKIYRPFLNIDEQNEWQAKISDPHFKNFVESISTTSKVAGVNNEFGGITLKPSGYVDINTMVDGVEAQLLKLGVLDQSRFKVEDLKINDGRVEYRGIKASKIVFCTGIDKIDYFDWLPFRPVKGEILEVAGKFQLKEIVNRGVFILPKGNGKFKVGATYNWKDLTLKISNEGKEFLIEKLRSLISSDFEVVGGKVGIRPTTPDRRPFIGQHPKNPELYVFNGFGTKGVSLVPYYARQFFEYLEKDKELDTEVNIKRYFSLI